MVYRIVSPSRPVGRTLAAIATSAMLAALTAPASAQGPVRTAQQKSRAAQQKPSQKPAAPAQAAPPAQAKQPPQIQLIYSPWTKFCLKGKEANAKQVCFTGKDGRIESGMPVVAAVLIEPEGAPKKILRVTVPLGMELQHGTRIIIDQNAPMNGPYVICFTNGCMSDYDATPDLINKLQKGHNLLVQAINANNQPISLNLPLTDFAKAHDGPPTDPKVFEEQQKKLQEELQRRADEARKKLESQTQQAAPPAAAAPAAPPPAKK
jgi:invasion protein IalB